MFIISKMFIQTKSVQKENLWFKIVFYMSNYITDVKVKEKTHFTSFIFFFNDYKLISILISHILFWSSILYEYKITSHYLQCTYCYELTL